jgi:hypothetical protein
VPGDVVAQQQAEPVEPTIHWAYASHFGTGWYKLSDRRNSFIVRMSPRWTFGEAGFDDNGTREVGYTLQIPVTLGVSQFDLEHIGGIVDLENLTTASIGLLASADIPMTERWSIRPAVQASFGAVLGENENAWTYKADIRSRYSFRPGMPGWSLLAEIGVAGYDPNVGQSDDFSYASIGAEFSHLVGRRGDRVIHWHVAYTELMDKIRLSGVSDERSTIANYWEAGAAFGKRDAPVRIWKLEFERLGLAYSVSETSDFRGVKFVFRSLYDQ